MTRTAAEEVVSEERGRVAFLRTVPHLAVQLRPGPDRVWYDECQRRPGNRQEERWENGGLFWVRTESSTLAGWLQPG